ncbi:uncharacterized protein BDZ83DRAFT_756782 [Colletotrichum acutatum]|uniref:Uncharacterized protein n=1 Tax=Glomerella acutata TaxID=27357 RepID=A0AAD8UDU3_GLOAC|nr:uncharacterized protein BDZ83DRAFT_756782 [Colletotrichum acutatum]KAK1713410.1 hypothetical protein BDZ83DRAFT_756782 [Colletotrichum acutatum]
MNVDNQVHQPPPPPYRPLETAAVVAKASSRLAGGESRALPKLPEGRWNLACSIGLTRPQLQLRSDGKLSWMHVPEDAKIKGFERDGFFITKGAGQITVAFQDTEWTCSSSSTAGMLLSDPHRQVRLMRLAQDLVVYEQANVNKEPGLRRPLMATEGQSEPLTVEIGSSGILTITGAAVYQVDGDGDDVVMVTSHQYRDGRDNTVGEAIQDLSLWDRKEGKFRWTHSCEKLGRIWGFTETFILMKVGNVHLHRRNDGKTHGTFLWPSIKNFIEFTPHHDHGPVMSTNGLLLRKPCSKAIFIWQVRDKRVHFRIWESTADIQGHLALRGSLDQLELVLVGQQARWTQYEVTEPIYKWSPLRRFMMEMF